MNDLRNDGIVLIGAGNLAVNLAHALGGKGYRILQIYDRNQKAGKWLARRTGAAFTGDLSSITKDAGIIFLAVSDDAIGTLAERICPANSLVVHCSGTTGIDIFKGLFQNYGVFNPVQTFLKTRPVSMKKAPFCIEANHVENERILTELALTLEGKPYLLTSEQRMTVHLCSVLTSNFTNWLNSIAEDILSKKGIPFEILLPLISRTIKNAEKGNISGSQTGPAIREDYEVIRKHLELLATNSEYHEIYEKITASIVKYKLSHGKL